MHCLCRELNHISLLMLFVMQSRIESYLCQLCPFSIFISHFCNIRLTIILKDMPKSPKHLSPSDFLTIILSAFLFSLIFATSLASFILLNYFQYRGADKSLARPISRCILFDGENISFDASHVIYK